MATPWAPAKWWSITVLSAACACGGASRLCAQVYTEPTLAVSVADDAGRIPPRKHTPNDVERSELAFPLQAVLFIDGTRAVSYVGPGSGTPRAALLVTDFVSRSVCSLDIGLPDGSGNRSLLAGFRPSRNSKEIVLLVQVEDGWIGRLGVDMSTNLFVVVVRDGEIVSRVGPIEIERENIMQEEDDRSSVYSVARDETESSGEAYKRFARVMLRDFDGDGFQDLLIWKRNFQFAEAPDLGRRIREIGGADYVLSSEQYLIALYRPSEFGFTAPAVSDHVPPPPESVWNDMPSLLHTPSKRR